MTVIEESGEPSVRSSDWRPRRAPGEAVALAFEGVSFPVVFRGCPEVVACLEKVVHGWPVRSVPVPADGPRIEIAPDRKGYRTDATWLDESLGAASAVETVCSLTVDLVQALVREDPGLLCLHCGAARLDGRLVVFTGASRAGKSTLVARLAASAVTVFSDDLLVLGGPQDHGRSLGLRGRLRLPLPGSSAVSFRHFVTEHAGPGDGRYLYLDAPAFAPYGESAPVGAVVLLDRKPGAAARLVRAGRAEALRHLVRRNVARGEAADAIIDRLHAVMAQASCLRLVYSDLEDAAALITDTFGRWPADGIAVRPSAVAAGDDTEPVKARRVRRATAYRRHPGVVVRDVDGELFLASAPGDSIWHLNALGAGVWNLLAEPVSPAAAAKVLSAAFPDAPEAAIIRDVDRLFAGLVAKGLIVEAGSGARVRPGRPARRATPAGRRGSAAPCAPARRR